MSASPSRYPNAVLLAMAGAGGVLALVPGVPPFAPLALLVATTGRALVDRRGPGRGLPPWGAAAWALGPAIALAYVAWTTQSTNSVVGALLAVGAVAAALSVLPRAARSPGLAGLQLAGGLVMGTTLYAPTPLVTGAALGFVLLLLRAAAALATREALHGAGSGDPSVRRWQAEGAANPRRRGGGALALAALGFPLGIVLFAVLPSAPGGWRLETPTVEDTPHGWGMAPATGGSGGAAGEGRSALSGLRVGRRSPYVAELRSNPRVMLRVRVGEGEKGPAPLWLRSDTYDAFDGRAWVRTPAAEAARAVPPDAQGWCRVIPEEAVRASEQAGRVLRLRCREVAGSPAGSLPLLPDMVRLRWAEDARAPALRQRADGSLATSAAREPDLVWEVESVLPATGRLELGPARSDPRDAPLPSYGRAPPEADALRRLAEEVIGGASRPSDRAARLEAWLQGPAFTYRLSALPMDRDRPVADFLLRARQGHCWCFASGMALLLRSLGHPTRLAVGYRGGDWLEGLGEWSFRGAHAHAWCEMWYEGIGWIPYDPTPLARESQTAAAPEAAPSFAERLLRFSPEDRRRLGERAWQALTERFDALLVGGLAVLTALGLLALARGLRGRRARARLALGVSPGTPYGRALAALARRGLPRRGSETPQEFRARADAALPVVGAPLETLTRLHEAERYGGHAAPGADVEGAVRAIVEGARRAP